MAPKVLEKAVEKFDAEGREGVAEDKSAKSINRSRAAGVWGRRALMLVGPMVFLGGVRHAEGDAADKLANGFGDVAKALISPALNSDGEPDMPFVDFPVIDFDFNSNEVSVSQAQPSAPSDRATVSSNGIAYDPSLGDRFYESDDYAVCNSQTEPTVIDGSVYVNDIILSLNPGLKGNKAAALNVSYNEFEVANPGVDADMPIPAGSVTTEVVFPTDCVLQ